MHKMHISAAALLALLAWSVPASAEEVMGAPRVIDGDSLKIDAVEIRMADIDAPEMKQGGPGRYAKVVLSNLIGGQDVLCVGRERDRYGRLVATCFAGGLNLNAAMVQAGAAFAYWPFRDGALVRQACPKPGLAECRRTTDLMFAAEDDARAARRGIWHFDPLPEYPWCARHPEKCEGR